MDRKVIIVGAGVAGLSLAILLRSNNIHCHVLESRLDSDGPTSGVRISSNGAKILESMGIKSIGEQTENLIMHAGGLTSNFYTGDGTDNNPPSLIVTRLALHEQLMIKFASLNIQLTKGFKVVSVTENSDRVVVTSQSGAKVEGDLVIGADGVGSVIRKLLNPGQASTKAYAGYLGLGMVFESETSKKYDFCMYHFPAHRLGVASCGKVNSTAKKDSIFMWTHLHMSEEEAKNVTRATVDAELDRRAAMWGGELKSLYDEFKSKPNAQMAYYPVYNGRPPGKWYSERMVLIGDAAHPYGPGGQGISMALKDAQLLCNLIVHNQRTDASRTSVWLTEGQKLTFQTERAEESRALGEAAEARNKLQQTQTEFGVFCEGVKFKALELFTCGKLKM